MSTQPLDSDTLKSRLKQTWDTGDYATVASYLETSAEDFLSRHAVEPGMRVLDAACGSGQAAIPLARAGADVHGIDIAPGSVAQARERARRENLDIRFREGDVESLPYEDESFDLVVSLIGAMFAPRPERVAAELVRVCRPEGRIVMGNWTPDGFIGQFLRTVGRHAPPPTGMPSPLEWGDESRVRELLHDGVASLDLTRRTYSFRYPFGPAEVVEHYLLHYGPTARAYAGLDDRGKTALRQDLERLWASANEARDGSTHVDAEILEVVAVGA